MEIRCYADFLRELRGAGFSMGGGKADGIFAVVDWGWQEQPPYDTPVKWHTEDADTDPWEWRMRVLDEESDIAYAKLFFKKSGFITCKWYPYFLAARRGDIGLDELYDAGELSSLTNKLYKLISEHGPIAMHGLKALAGIGREDKAQFEKSITELQMKMYITMCGRQRKLSQMGLEYGWSSTVLCTADVFFGQEVVRQVAELSPEQAFEKISEQIYRLNPSADPKKVTRFIMGK